MPNSDGEAKLRGGIWLGRREPFGKEKGGVYGEGARVERKSGQFGKGVGRGKSGREEHVREKGHVWHLG